MSNVIITGGNQGMGLQQAIAMCRLAYRVVISCRSAQKGDEAVAAIKAAYPPSEIAYLIMDLNSLESVRAFAAQYAVLGRPLHVLVNNAGIMNTPFAMTADGFESQFQTNHLGHFLLTHLLMPTFAPGARVINLASWAHNRHGEAPIDFAAMRTVTAQTYNNGGQNVWAAYGASKLCNILFAKALAKRFPHASSGYTFNALHPGLVQTELIVKGAPGMFNSGKSIDDGIKCSMYLATSPDVAGVSGVYFHENTQVAALERGEVTRIALDEDAADAMWVASLAFVGLRDGDFGVSLQKDS